MSNLITLRGDLVSSVLQFPRMLTADDDEDVDDDDAPVPGAPLLEIARLLAWSGRQYPNIGGRLLPVDAHPSHLWWALEPQRLAVALCYVVLHSAGLHADARTIGDAPPVLAALTAAFPALKARDPITVADLFACLRVQLGEGFKRARAAAHRDGTAPHKGAAVRRGTPLLLRVVPVPPRKAGAGGAAAVPLTAAEMAAVLARVEAEEEEPLGDSDDE